MVFNKQLFRKVTIVGVGLIGGSIGLAIRKHNLAREIVGVSQKSTSLDYALKIKAIDRGFTDLQAAIQHSDLIILATPVLTIINFLVKLAPLIRHSCIITDVGSTKKAIVEAAHKILPNHAFFIGSHPLAGSEKMGVVNAIAELFENSSCIITPTDKTNRLARDKIKHFWAKVGADVKVLTPEEHDKALAFISHLPHLLAYGLIDSIPSEFIPFAAQGLKDTTRIASSSPQMWNDICLSNSEYILKTLDEFVKNIGAFRRAIMTKDEKELIEHLQRAKNKRDNLSKNA
ncbi:MAG: hypothetical protein A2Z88_02905 [Omnitrophica WOR_2 bacterium GWA2_47_8]|nr:MAG: hypothetical protein A2Z88_02905 [Omnitrophica WOR_2 bacterium GWA2_47_8]